MRVWELEQCFKCYKVLPECKTGDRAGQVKNSNTGMCLDREAMSHSESVFDLITLSYSRLHVHWQ
jgi:hypothetical protein